MKLTNEQINALSDPEINVMMTRVVHNAHKYTEYDDKNKWIYCEDRVHGNLDGVKVEDYCNDPAVMMPIALEVGISLINTDGSGEYTACGVGTLVDGYCGDKRNDVYIDGDALSNTWRDKKPCRAAAIVYLKSKGVL